MLWQMIPIHTPNSVFIRYSSILSFNLRLDHPSGQGLFPSGFRTEIFYAFLIKNKRSKQRSNWFLKQYLWSQLLICGAGVAQAVYCLTAGWMIGVRSPTGAEDFSSSPCVQTGFEAHPASYPMGTEDPFPGGKSGRGVTLTTHPCLVPRLSMSRSYNSSPPMCLYGM
jgi:hypothetical protein